MIKVIFEDMPITLAGTVQKDEETGEVTIYVNSNIREKSGDLVFYERKEDGIKPASDDLNNVIQNITQIGGTNTIQNISQVVKKPEEDEEADFGTYATEY
jgi:tRNA A58 N-methylase Trm61